MSSSFLCSPVTSSHRLTKIGLRTGVWEILGHMTAEGSSASKTVPSSEAGKKGTLPVHCLFPENAVTPGMVKLERSEGHTEGILLGTLSKNGPFVRTSSLALSHTMVKVKTKLESFK